MHGHAAIEDENTKLKKLRTEAMLDDAMPAQRLWTCGQRKSVVHMPTASATTANLRHGRMIEVETEAAEISN
jgi:hypothetical protein